MTMSKVNERQHRDRYEPIKRLAMIQTQLSREPSKPLTSFCIKDILANHNHDAHYHQVSHTAALHCPTYITVNSEGKFGVELHRDTGHRSSGHWHTVHGHFMSLCHLDRTRQSVKELSPAVSLNPVKESFRNFRLSYRKLAHRQFEREERQIDKPADVEREERQIDKPADVEREERQIDQPAGPTNMSTKIVRPWDNHLAPCCTGSYRRQASSIPLQAVVTGSESSSDGQYHQISVDDNKEPSLVAVPRVCHNSKSVCPLDALMAMTSKTFDGIDAAGPDDNKRRDKTALLGKHQVSKKRRKSRTAFSNQQIYELEKRFLYQKYLTPADRDEISTSLALTNAQVITWFQNRRAKLKRDLEELKNDVSAAKKLPSHTTAPDPYLELGLRTGQGQKPREGISSAVHSPVSRVNINEDDQDVSHTPGPCPAVSGGASPCPAVCGGASLCPAVSGFASPCPAVVDDGGHALCDREQGIDRDSCDDVKKEPVDYKDDPWCRDDQHNRLTIWTNSPDPQPSRCLPSNDEPQLQTRSCGFQDFNQISSLGQTTITSGLDGES